MADVNLGDPAAVFTPARPVQRDMFAGRHYQRVQERFEEKLSEPGRQIVLYGDTGVGKTSLVNYIADTSGLNTVRVECGAPFETMVQEALSRAGVTEEVVETIDTKSAEGGVGVTLSSLFRLGGSVKRESSTTRRAYPVSLQTAVREALAVQGVAILFLDNCENLKSREHGADATSEIVQLMKSFSDKGEGAKLVVAGIPKESDRLVSIDEATGRRTSQIEVPRMPDEELDEILRLGEGKLGLTFEPFCRGRIIEVSDGFPYYTHLHALHAARQARRDNSEEVTLAHFENALVSIIEDADLRLRVGYEEATETTGTVKTRKSVLEAIAILHKHEVTFREIKASFSKLHPRYDANKLDFINPHLGDLVDKYGLLQARGVKKSANRTYRFADPLMRAFVLLKQEQERQPRLSGGF